MYKDSHTCPNNTDKVKNGSVICVAYEITLKFSSLKQVIIFNDLSWIWGQTEGRRFLPGVCPAVAVILWLCLPCPGLVWAAALPGLLP